MDKQQSPNNSFHSKIHSGRIIMDFTESYTDTCSSVGMAARMGDLGCVQDLVWHGKPVDVRDNRGWTPIHEAAFHGHSGCLEFLLRQDVVEPEWRTFEDETALILAARGGHFECVRTLLDCDADPTAETKEGYTPLWEAISAESFECVRLLMRKGAVVQINYQNYTGFTPLHAAAERGYTHILDYLVKHGARLDMCADVDITPIFLASQFGHKDCLQILLQTAREKGQMDLVNKTTHDHATPLLIASQEGHEDCIRLLLSYGADPNIPVKDLNAVAAHFAVYKDRPRCLQLVLPVTRQEVLFNTVDTMMHPLILGLKLKNTTCLEILIAAGLNVKAFLPLNQDLFEMDRHLLFTVLQYDNSASVLCQVEESWPSQGIEFLLRAGLPCNIQNPQELPPLISALSKADFNLFLLLLKYGANPNIYHDRVGGNLPILLALRNDMLPKLIVIDMETRRNLFGKYLIPLLMAGANAQSCFSALNMVTEELIFDLHHVLQGSVEWTNLFPLLVLLLCFTCNVSLDEKLCALAQQFKADRLLKKIEDSSGTLSHACRKKVVQQFASSGCYNKESVCSLPVPSILHEYLLFMEYGTHISEIVQDSLKYLTIKEHAIIHEIQTEEGWG
ncbi:ankyrin repeat and SOCS box protein 3-like [Ylistrum balloti]|uniref:ankyrin repeat and SOCS box protein 3-like n=1 Tax=Ylistrum balloti TaxID=509963 RepID=UPI002905F1C2|nr:ankyrin repeat and SOCS box protein 3-like [Ylistrum balloti]